MSKSQLSVLECDRILTAPGSVLEMEERILHGRKVRTWKHCPPTFRSYFLESCTKYTSRTFLSSPVEPSGRQEWTFGQVVEESLKLAGWMKSRGLGIGSRIAIGGGNSAGWIIAFVAVHLIGGIAVALNAWLPLDSLVYCLELTKPALVLVDARLAELLDPAVLTLRRKGMGESLSAKMSCSPEQLRQIKDGTSLDDLNPESDAIIFFTSGTGGRPKAVLSTQRMALTNLWSGLVAPIRAALRAGVTPPPMPKPTDPQKIVLLAVPLFHVTGCLSWLMRAFFTGNKMIMMSRWSIHEAVSLIQSQKVTVIGGVPAIVSEILESPALDKNYSFETVFYGGAPPSRELANEVKRRWPKTGLVQGYGMTETNAYVCSVAGADYVLRPDTTGPAVPVCDVRIADPRTGRALPPGSPGLLMVHGPQVMKGYYNDPKATSKVIDQDGWLDTGDIAVLDHEGFIYIKDRAKDIIIRGGENIASSDVENALYAHPGVLEAAAISVPDKRLGEKVGAIVSVRSDWTGRVTEESLLEDVKSRLGKPAWPSIILISNDPLPHNVNGKVVKRDLRPMLVEAWEKRKRVDAGRLRSKL
ncbi:hypothetical protein BD324DRAFT_650512 [Kockovaella imperatae]|uniref:Long-chain-fatty-acid--CoA ligase n=1 Tax=Kockovaella imperatae TaxID=4999 RepID=A0A1Y1UIV8_9TREE|nr:hypothetical protein BD324DRAFT_650512 [Kockovaella imperatae]ORX37971.1 hypothetical protein BD324DRAFT_650512 [Kockovaella imperatae]